MVADLCCADYRKSSFNPISVSSAQTGHDNLYTFLLLNLRGFFNAYL